MSQTSPKALINSLSGETVHALDMDTTVFDTPDVSIEATTNQSNIGESKLFQESGISAEESHLLISTYMCS